MSKVLPTPVYSERFRKLAELAGGISGLASALGVSRDPVRAVMKGEAVLASTWLLMSNRLPDAEKKIRRAATGHGDPNSANARQLRVKLVEARRQIAALVQGRPVPAGVLRVAAHKKTA